MSVVGDGITADNARWTFDGIADSFEAHVSKSVPLYREGHDLIARIADFFLDGPGMVYDLGTSTGRLVRTLIEHNPNRPNLRIVGVDHMPSMIERAQALTKDPRASFICQDIVELDMEQCSLVTSYLTMQFVHPSLRQQLMDKVYNSLAWGGAFIMFEKVRAPDARFQDYMTLLYNDFKLASGFSEEEIVQKARSLKGVQEPFSTGGNLGLLSRAGFQDVMTVFKWVSFECFLAIK